MGFSVEQMKNTISDSAGMAMGNMFLVQLPSDIEQSTGTSGGFFDRLGDAVDKFADSVNSSLDKLSKNIGINNKYTSHNDMAILCKSTSMPGRQILSIDRRIGIHSQKVAYGYADDTVTMTFYVTNDMKMKDYFDAWQRMAVDPNNPTVRYYDEYVRNITILHLKKGAGIPVTSGDLNLPKIPSIIKNRLPSIGPLNLSNDSYNVSVFTGNDVTQKVTLFGAWPTTVQAIEMNNEAGLMELSVTFTYKKWVINKKDSKVDNGFLSAAVGSIARKLF